MSGKLEDLEGKTLKKIVIDNNKLSISVFFNDGCMVKFKVNEYSIYEPDIEIVELKLNNSYFKIEEKSYTLPMRDMG